MFLYEGLPFNKLESSRPSSLRRYLENGVCKLPRHTITDIIPKCLDLEMQTWLNEIPQDKPILKTSQEQNLTNKFP